VPEELNRVPGRVMCQERRPHDADLQRRSDGFKKCDGTFIISRQELTATAKRAHVIGDVPPRNNGSIRCGVNPYLARERCVRRLRETESLRFENQKIGVQPNHASRCFEQLRGDYKTRQICYRINSLPTLAVNPLRRTPDEFLVLNKDVFGAIAFGPCLDPSHTRTHPPRVLLCD